MSITVYEELQNLIIGGEFNINPWQRGTTFVSPASGSYSADRFQYFTVGAQTYTITRDNSGPNLAESGIYSTKSFRIDVTTANAALGAAEYTTVEQPIEGHVALPIYGNYITVSFWAYSVLPGTYCFALQNNTRTRNYIVEYTINSASTWESFEFVIKQDPSIGVWETGSLTGIRAIFCLAAGNTYHGAPNVWQAGNLFATVNQVNLANNVVNDFRIDMLRISRGVTRAYILRDIVTELRLCQHYYEKSYNISVIPGTITQAGESAGVQSNNTSIISLQNPFVTTKRATPSITWYSPGTGAINNIYRYSAASDHAVVATTSTGQRVTGWPSIGGGPVGTEWGAHWTANAEL